MCKYAHHDGGALNMNLNWDDMRFFLALCRTDSFVAAAHELKVTHSTVARRISALEASWIRQRPFSYPLNMMKS
jgi:hypothetical protein